MTSFVKFQHGSFKIDAHINLTHDTVSSREELETAFAGLIGWIARFCSDCGLGDIQPGTHVSFAVEFGSCVYRIDACYSLAGSADGQPLEPMRQATQVVRLLLARAERAIIGALQDRYEAWTFSQLQGHEVIRAKFVADAAKDGFLARDALLQAFGVGLDPRLTPPAGRFTAQLSDIIRSLTADANAR